MIKTESITDNELQ